MEKDTKKQGQLLRIVMEEAAKKRERYNLAQYKKNREDKLVFHDICVKLKKYYEESNLSMNFLVYIGVGTTARKALTHKGIEFSHLNEKKLKKIIAWMKEFANYNENSSFYKSDRIGHAMSKFYDQYGGNTNVFREAKNKFSKMPKDEYKSNCFTTANQFYNLFVSCLNNQEPSTEETTD